MNEITKLLRHRGVQAGAAVVLGAGAVAMSGVAGAAENADETVAAVGDATEGQWDKQSVTIQTGESVTWTFPGEGHNVESTSSDPGTGAAKDPRWAPWAYPPGTFQVAPVGSSGTYTFYKSGTYNFICVFHPNMTGTVTVNGEDLEIPTPTATATPTATPTNDPNPPQPPQPTVSPQPTPDDHTQTPAPGGGAADRTKPVISSVRLRGIRRGARVRFRLSEAATVTLQFRKRGSKRVIRTVRVHASAGTRNVTVRNRRLRKGRYTVTLSARDAMGNRATARRKALRIRR